MKGLFKSGLIVGTMLLGYTVLEDQRNKIVENWEMNGVFKSRLEQLDSYIKELRAVENKNEDILKKIENLETVEIFVGDFLKIKEKIYYNVTNDKSTRRLHDLRFDKVVGDLIDEIEVRGNEKEINNKLNEISLILNEMRKLTLNIKF